MSLEILKWEFLVSRNETFPSAAINSWPKCLFNFQFFKANNISLKSSTFADLKNHSSNTLVAEKQSFQFRKFYSIRLHCSKNCEGPRKRAEPRARRVRGNLVVGELLASSWQGNDDCPQHRHRFLSPSSYLTWRFSPILKFDLRDPGPVLLPANQVQFYCQQFVELRSLFSEFPTLNNETLRPINSSCKLTARRE